eukprot:431999_1
MSERLSVQTCNRSFVECECAKRIKSILQQYSKVAFDNSKTDIQLQNEAGALVHKLPMKENYSNVKLLNDYYHIKYIHNANENSKQFDEFSKYLSDVGSYCDPLHCKTVERHINRRNMTFVAHENEMNHQYMHSLNLICRIHTYFLHSHDALKLPENEIKYIETIQDATLNKLTLSGKYITTDHQYLDYDKIFHILQQKCLVKSKITLVDAFDVHCYHKQQLIDDLCKIFINVTQKTSDTLLEQIICNELKITQPTQQKQIYEVLLYKYIQKTELNNNNFIQILQYIASTLYPSIKCDQIAIIARDHNLTGKIFVKGSAEFKNSIKFAKLFQSTLYWTKKSWKNIFMAFNKWQPLKLKLSVTESKENDVHNNVEEKYEKKEELKQLEVKTDVDYIDKGTDQDSISKFCMITNTTKNTAAMFLKNCNWNIMTAINSFYSVNGDVSKLNPTSHHNQAIEQNTNTVYTHGVSFWYWKKQSSNKRYIKSKFPDLRSEILNFRQITPKMWNHLIYQCDVLIKSDKIRHITSNGNNADIYCIPNSSPISVQHLHAIKLYTDFTSLCNIFCAAFRLKKISEFQYERVASLIIRNEKIANWARLLAEAVQSFGALQYKTGKKYFRGVSKIFMFKKFIIKFNLPLSTTSDFTNATEFAQGAAGLVVELGIHNEFVCGLDCSLFSAFDHEKETLFFGHDSILRIFSLYQWFDKKWSNYGHYIRGIQTLIDIANGSISWKRKNSLKDIMGYIFPELYASNKQLPPYIIELLNYHLTNMPKRIEYDFQEINNCYQWVKHIFLKPTGVPHVSNACNLFMNSSYIIFMLSHDQEINDDFCDSVVNDLADVNNKSIAVDFRWNAEKSMEILNSYRNMFKQFSTLPLIINSLQIDVCEQCNSITIQPKYLKQSISSINISSQKIQKTAENNWQKLIEAKPSEKGLNSIIMTFINIYFKSFGKCKHDIPDAISWILYNYLREPDTEKRYQQEHMLENYYVLPCDAGKKSVAIEPSITNTIANIQFLNYNMLNTTNNISSFIPPIDEIKLNDDRRYDDTEISIRSNTESYIYGLWIHFLWGDSETKSIGNKTSNEFICIGKAEQKNDETRSRKKNNKRRCPPTPKLKIRCPPTPKLKPNTSRKSLSFASVLYVELVDIYPSSKVVGILTYDQLYFVPAKNYPIWKEFSLRTGITQLPLHIIINNKNAVQLTKNLNLTDDEVLANSTIVPYFFAKTAMKIKLDILLRQTTIPSVSSLFDIIDNYYQTNRLSLKIVKSINRFNINSINCIQIKNIIANSDFMKFIFKGTACFGEMQRGDSTIVILKHFRNWRVIKSLEERTKIYCLSKGITNSNVTISSCILPRNMFEWPLSDKDHVQDINIDELQAFFKLKHDSYEYKNIKFCFDNEWMNKLNTHIANRKKKFDFFD